MSAPAFILDNGACCAKLGLSTNEAAKVVPNCIMKAKSERRRPFIGNQMEDCRDASGLFYVLCFQKGYLINWDIQRTVWDYMFSSECCPVNFTETPLIVTEPQFNFHSIQEAMTEVFFEEYECEAIYRTTTADLADYQYRTQSKSKILCTLVVDTGYSFTHVVPFIKGRKVKKAIRRIDVGGKLLTNHLKELISYRQLNVMDESYVINQVKEDACFVSNDFNADMKIAKNRFPSNTIVRDYVLPDFTSLRRGYVRKLESNAVDDADVDQQCLRLNNERFTIPEILFRPSDIGIKQMGIPEAIICATEACPEECRPHLLANIIVIGGSAQFPGFQERLQREVRMSAPDDCDVNVTVVEDPQTYAWSGGVSLSQSDQFSSMCLKREQFEEEGVDASLEKFDI